MIPLLLGPLLLGDAGLALAAAFGLSVVSAAGDRLGAAAADEALARLRPSPPPVKRRKRTKAKKRRGRL